MSILPFPAAPAAPATDAAAPHARPRRRAPAPLLGLALGAALWLGGAGPTPAVAAPVGNIDALCGQLAGRLKSLDAETCRNAGLVSNGGTTPQGAALLYRDYTPASSGQPFRVLVIGGIHGDEFTSTAIAFQWMQQLASRRAGQAFAWRVIPCANPDGMLAKPATRMNSHGVDLNRNFDTPDWSAYALTYWKKNNASDPRRYPGPRAQSEPETRWLAAQIADYKPDAIVSIHAPYGLLDYDGPPETPRKMGYLSYKELGVYPGSLGNYAGVHMGIPVVTMELPHAETLPTPSQNTELWADLNDWLERNLPRQASRNRSSRAAAPAKAAPRVEEAPLFLPAAGDEPEPAPASAPTPPPAAAPDARKTPAPATPSTDGAALRPVGTQPPRFAPARLPANAEHASRG